MSVDSIMQSTKRLFKILIFLFILKFSELFALQILNHKASITGTLLFIFTTSTAICLLHKKSSFFLLIFACFLLVYIILDYSRSSHYSLIVLLYFAFLFDHFLRLSTKDFIALLNFTLALVYFFGALNKINTGFLSGFVIYKHSIFHETLNSLGFNTLVSIILVLISILVVTFELMLSVLLFINRVSSIVLSTAIWFHLSIIILMHEFLLVNFMELVIFNVTCIVFLTSSFAGGTWPAYCIIWDQNCSFCKSTIQLIRKADFLHTLQFIPNSNVEALNGYGISREQSKAAMQVVDVSTNIVYSGFFGFRRLLLVLIPFAILFPLMSIPMIERLGGKTYEIIASRRSCGL